jgi:hypothetical protein
VLSAISTIAAASVETIASRSHSMLTLTVSTITIAVHRFSHSSAAAALVPETRHSVAFLLKTGVGTSRRAETSILKKSRDLTPGEVATGEWIWTVLVTG